jgi:LAGLIDADG DNA endonuclease family
VQSLSLGLWSQGARGRQETKNGLKSNILNKIKDTIFGQKNIILKGKYGKENLNINFELKFRMNQALREEFNVHTPWPLLLFLVIKSKIGFNGQKVGPLYPLLFTLQKQRQKVGAREKIKKMNQMYQSLQIKQPKTSPFLGVTRGLNNISARMHPHNTKNFFHTRCRAINRIGPHNTDIISTIFGLLLGDGIAINRTGEGVRISIKQSIIHTEYLFSLYEFFFLRGYCSNLIPRKYNRTIKGIDKIYSGYEFNTFTFRSFVWIYNSFYKNGTKKLPLNMEEFITPLTLAI